MLGGFYFCLSMVWARVFPFVAVTQYYDNEDAETITLILVGCFVLWLVLNIAFFCTIDLS